MGKLFGKKLTAVDKSCCEDCKCVEEKRFLVTFTLSDKYWNEELKRYLFVGFNRGDAVTVAETPEITINTSELWRMNDMLYSGDISNVTVKAVN